ALSSRRGEGDVPPVWFGRSMSEFFLGEISPRERRGYIPSQSRTSLTFPLSPHGERDRVRGESLTFLKATSYARLFARADTSEPASPSTPPRRSRSRSNSAAPADSITHSYSEDATVDRDSQAQALDQAGAMSDRAQDPKLTILWSQAKKEM